MFDMCECFLFVSVNGGLRGASRLGGPSRLGTLRTAVPWEPSLPPAFGNILYRPPYYPDTHGVVSFDVSEGQLALMVIVL